MIACDRCPEKVEAEWHLEGKRDNRIDDSLSPPRFTAFTLCDPCRVELWGWLEEKR